MHLYQLQDSPKLPLDARCLYNVLQYAVHDSVNHQCLEMMKFIMKNEKDESIEAMTFTLTYDQGKDIIS